MEKSAKILICGENAEERRRLCDALIKHGYRSVSDTASSERALSMIKEGSYDLIITYAILNTILCLLVGYPVAFFLADKKINKSAILVTLFIMPMWINFVIRTGATRDLLNWLNISGGTYPELATLIGLVYNYLPFTILPLYTTMLKMDRSQIEASKDLGANGFQTFTRVIIPLTMPGIVSAATMVFMPTISSYVISDILSEYNVVLFGTYIDLYFNQNDWNFGSFMALIMLVLILLSVVITRKFSNEDEGKESIW